MCTTSLHKASQPFYHTTIRSSPKWLFFSITIASLADVYVLNQSATDWQGEGAVNFPVRAATHLWKGRVALWVLCMRWWKHLCHLHTSQSLLAGSPRGTAQPSPVSPYCFCKPRICSAQTSASEASSWSCLCLVFLSVFCWLNCSISQSLSCVSVAVL